MCLFKKRALFRVLRLVFVNVVFQFSIAFLENVLIINDLKVFSLNIK